MLLADPNRTIDETQATDEEDQVTATAADDAAPADTADMAVEADADDRPLCSHCDRRLDQKQTTVCPHCGYYAALGICIDLDEEWERMASGHAAAPVQAETDAKPTNELLKHVQVWIDLVPIWGWKLIGWNLAILAVSLMVRLAVPGSLRTIWSVTQLFAGISAAVTCHIIVYLVAISDDASLSMLDIVLKPFKLWKGTLRALPKTLRLTTGGSCGLSAMVGSLLIIGAIPYGVLLDWGIKEPPKQNLMGAIVAQAQKAKANEDGLEEAVEDFAGTAGDAIDKLAGNVVEKNVRVDCLIIGYTVHPKNKREITSLLVAREFYGNLKYVGRLTDGLDEHTRFDLVKELELVPRNEPFVTLPAYIKAQWVQPKYTCRVKCVKETRSGSLIEMELDEMLGKINR